MPGRVDRVLRQHQAKTVFVRVPNAAWPLVSTGKIAEFRGAVGNASAIWKVPLPTLAVCYRRQTSVRATDYKEESRRPGEYHYRLMMLEDARQEALGAIGDDGLRLAGYHGDRAFARFRRDWTISQKRRFEPLMVVWVYRVRPVQEGDLEAAGLGLVNHLYEEFLCAIDRPTTVKAKPRPVTVPPPERPRWMDPVR